MRIKRYFNMIEVMLAIVVITVGLASVFVLFPAGLSSHKKATADNNIADLAELVVSSVRAQISIETSKGDNFDTVAWAGYSDNSSDADADTTSLSKWQVLDLLKTGSADDDDVNNASLLQHTEKKNIFWVRQMSGPENDRFVDFSAIARIYVDKDCLDEEFFFDPKEEEYKQFSELSKKPNDDTGKFLMPLVLEISYPAEVKYSEREKRYFRFEVFNEHYKISE